MDLRALKRRCESRLQGLDLPTPFDVRAFCDSIAAKRGRPIDLRPVVTHAGPWGLWAATDSADYIFYESDTSPLHQEHIILHEISHLICGHHPVPISRTDLLHEMLPNLSPDTIKQVLGRISYADEDEQEAEVLASVLLERISVTRPRGTLLSPGLAESDVEVLYQLGATLRAHPEEA